jgi:IS5 family transposase
VPWALIEGDIKPVYPEAGNGRRPYPLSTMLRVYLMQNWFSLSDLGMDDVRHADAASLRETVVAGRDPG